MIDKQITTKTIQMFKNKLYVKYTSRNDQVSTGSRSSGKVVLISMPYLGSTVDYL